jgi:tRNA pseudouridine38/39 synthase
MDTTVRTKKAPKTYDWSKARFQQFLIKFSYVGTRYCGVAYQDEETPTVEREIFRALCLTKMVKSREECNFSRCGRTDAGVHAAGNYLCLALRVDPPIDHLKVINKVLPSDIRFLALREVPESFSARFDCKGRIYKYYQPLWSGLDVARMHAAAQKFLGEHDFRNFCKMDVGATTNYVRRIFSIEFKLDTHKSVLEIEIRGNAFLWHQVRCIVAILLLIGESLEDIELVDELLDYKKTPRKPLYRMADPSGLVLYDCIFQLPNPVSIDECQDTLMSHREALAESLRLSCVLQAINGLGSTETGMIDRWTEQNRYTQLLARATCPSLEEKVHAHQVKKKAKMEADGLLEHS